MNVVVLATVYKPRDNARKRQFPSLATDSGMLDSKRHGWYSCKMPVATLSFMPGGSDPV